VLRWIWIFFNVVIYRVFRGVVIECLEVIIGCLEVIIECLEGL